MHNLRSLFTLESFPQLRDVKMNQSTSILHTGKVQFLAPIQSCTYDIPWGKLGKFGTSFLPAGIDPRQDSRRDRTSPPDNQQETGRKSGRVDCVVWTGTGGRGEGGGREGVKGEGCVFRFFVSSTQFLMHVLIMHQNTQDRV